MSCGLIEALCFTLSLPQSLCVGMMRIHDWINTSAWHTVSTIISLNDNEYCLLSVIKLEWRDDLLRCM